MDQNERRNLWIAFILSTLVLLGWNYFFEAPKRAPVAPMASTTTAPVPAPAPAPELKTVPVDLKQALQTPDRVQIITPALTGSINLKGARIDDLTLKNYHKTTDPHSDPIRLLDPQGTLHAYYAEFGWSSDKRSVLLPDVDAVWTADSTTLTPEKPLTLRYQTTQGLIFEQIIAVDNNYLFTITQRVIHQGAEEIPLQSYGLISRHGVPETQGFFILHEGPIGYLNQKLVEVSYKDLAKAPTRQESRGGWLGITDKYWLTALIPAQDKMVKTGFQENGGVGHERFQTDFTTASQMLKPGESLEQVSHFFAGAKVLDLLEQYETQLKVNHFDKAVDFGWFYFLTKPIFHILTWTHEWLGNFGLAIMLLTVILKLMFFPLANKSYRSMAQMKMLQPEIERIRSRFSQDKMRLNQEIMEFYKKQKVNPVAGCLPMIIQIPVFFALYKVLFVSIEMRQAPFYGWIHDLSAPDPTSLFNLFGLIPWTPPTFLMLGIWPLLMGLTMYAQQKLNPPPVDPAQAKIFMFMPLLFTYMLASFPAGLVIYWTWNNILTIAQQWTIMQMAAQKKPLEISQRPPHKKRKAISE